MFDNLSDRLQGIMHKIKGYGKITDDNIGDMMREIRLNNNGSNHISINGGIGNIDINTK